jgi:hypothetical protein
MPILDQYGAPARNRYPAPFIGLYDTPANDPAKSRPRPLLRPHTFQNITSWQRWELTNYSRVIRSGIPNIEAALEFKGNFCFGGACHIKSKSSDKVFAGSVEDEINHQFYHNPNILGPEHDFWTMATELSVALDCDGGYGCVFDEETGRVRVIPSTSIGNGWGLQDTATGMVSPLGKGWNDYGMWGLAWGGWASYGGLMFGYMVISDPKSQFNGARIIDGIIVDRNMVRLGVRVLGFDDDGKMAYKDIPAAQVHLNFESKWSDQIGFIPQLSTAIMSIVNVQDFDYYIKQAMILSAALSVTRKSKDGKSIGSGIQETLAEPPYQGPMDQGGQPGGRRRREAQMQFIGAGLVELSTDNEEGLEAVKFERPSMNEEEFVERVERGYLAKHWPYDLFYGKEMGRAFIRAVGQQVKAIVKARQRSVGRTITWMVTRRINWDMTHGLVPQNNAAMDPYRFHILWPAEFTTDEANDRQADRDDLKMGLTTRSHIIGKNGGGDEHYLEIRVEEEDSVATSAEALAKKHPFLDAAGWLERLDQRSPNPLQLPPEKKQNPDADTAAPGEDKKGLPA